MAFTPRHGKGAKATVGNTPTTLYKASWEVREQGEDADTTNFESSGYETGLLGIQSAEWTVTGLWDAGQIDVTDPPGLYARDDLTNLKLYTNYATDADLYTFATARVRSARCSANVRQAVAYEASGRSQGSWTRPS